MCRRFGVPHAVMHMYIFSDGSENVVHVVQGVCKCLPLRTS